jgi:hypothetical protein
MNQKSKFIALATAVASVIAGATAQAQNTNFANGDLILGFQSKAGTGSDTNVMVNLGNTATVFRDANTNSINLDNIVNVNSILTATFGANWWDNTNLLWGAAGVWGNVNEGNLQNGDPEQSIYVTKSRTAIGANEEIANSTVTTPSASNQTAASNNIIALNNTFETQAGSPSQFSVLNTTPNDWEGFNVTSGGFVQSNAFTAFVGGTQQRFGAGSYGNSIATGSPVAIEGALDLYRSQGQNNVSGQFAEGDTLRVGRFQGILTIDNAGNVDFLTTVVPEPSSALLLGAASIIGLGIRRRRTVTA